MVQFFRKLTVFEPVFNHYFTGICLFFDRIFTAFDLVHFS